MLPPVRRLAAPFRAAGHAAPARRDGPLTITDDPYVQDQPLRVVIAEDSALTHEGIARLIEESGGIVVAKVGDGPGS